MRSENGQRSAIWSKPLGADATRSVGADVTDYHWVDCSVGRSSDARSGDALVDDPVVAADDSGDSYGIVIELGHLLARQGVAPQVVITEVIPGDERVAFHAQT